MSSRVAERFDPIAVSAPLDATQRVCPTSDLPHEVRISRDRPPIGRPLRCGSASEAAATEESEQREHDDHDDHDQQDGQDAEAPFKQRGSRLPFPQAFLLRRDPKRGRSNRKGLQWRSRSPLLRRPIDEAIKRRGDPPKYAVAAESPAEPPCANLPVDACLTSADCQAGLVE